MRKDSQVLLYSQEQIYLITMTGCEYEREIDLYEGNLLHRQRKFNGLLVLPKTTYVRAYRCQFVCR